VTVNGGFAEYALVPARNAYLIGDLDFPTAALCEPLACVVSGVERAQPRLSDDAVIFGVGAIGLMWLQLLRQRGVARLVAVDLSTARLDLAARLGADAVVRADGREISRLLEISPRGFDLVVEATGVPEVSERMVQVAAPDARVVIFGVAPGEATITVRPYDIFRRELRILGSFSLCNTMEPALRLLQAWRLVTEPLLSHVFSLEDFPQALAMVRRPEALKIQVHFA
jgi:threonine dehydrogenase-like Zn-dependent dehydrogenase